MNRQEHLLTCLAEECAEVAHRVSKALRFGLDDIEPGQEFSNARRIEQEVIDLTAVLIMCREMNMISTIPNFDAIRSKRKKVEKYMEYAVGRGTLK